MSFYAFKHTNNYRPKIMFQEGNVFSRVCIFVVVLSMGRRSPVNITHDVLDLAVQGPLPLDMDLAVQRPHPRPSWEWHLVTKTGDCSLEDPLPQPVLTSGGYWSTYDLRYACFWNAFLFILCVIFREIGQSLESELLEVIMKEMDEPGKRVKESSDELKALSHKEDSDTESESEPT